MKTFNNLSAKENDELLKLPAYISFLSAYTDFTMDEVEKKAAIKFTHAKAISCDPFLAKFFKKADEIFEKNIAQLENDLPKERGLREAAIKKELSKLEKTVLKLGITHADIMHKSMTTFRENLLKAHQNVIVDFLFPVPVPGLTQ